MNSCPRGVYILTGAKDHRQTHALCCWNNTAPQITCKPASLRPALLTVTSHGSEGWQTPAWPPPPGLLVCLGQIWANLSLGEGWEEKGKREQTRTMLFEDFRLTHCHFHCILLGKVSDKPTQLQGADLLSHFAKCVTTERPIIRVISTTSVMR